MPPIPAMQEAAHELIAEQCQRIAIPKRFTMPIREIWDMQERLPRRSGKRADLLLDNPRFRAGYDFLLLRESAGEETDGLGEWWTDYQDANDSERRDMIRDWAAVTTAPAPRKRAAAAKRKRAGDGGRITMERIYIGLGSNLATRRTVAQRRQALARLPRLVAVSAFYQRLAAARPTALHQRGRRPRQHPGAAGPARCPASHRERPGPRTPGTLGPAHPGSGYPAVR
jgi:hypothetical protein